MSPKPIPTTKKSSTGFSSEQRQRLRKLCQTQLFFLAKEVLGYDKLQDPFHRTVCEFIAGVESKRLLMMPREFFKTTLVTIADTLQRILQCLPEKETTRPRYPVSQLLVTSTFENVVPWIAKVKEHLTMNEFLRLIFPELEPDTNWWREGSIRLKGQRVPGLTSGNVDGIGVGGEATGRHYNIAKMDDVVNPKNSRTPAGREEVIRWHAMMQPILGQGMEFVVGTRYHYADVYGKLLADEDYQRLIFTWHDENGESAIPEVYSTEYFLKKREKMGSFLFAAQYENEPTPKEDATFQESWLKFYTSIPEGTKLYIVMLVDPSPGLKTGDPAGIVVVGECVQTGDWYILYSEAHRYPIEDLVGRIFTLWKQFRPHETTIEYNGTQSVLRDYLDRRRKREQIPMRIRYATAESMMGKETRIGALVGKFEFGNVYLRVADTELRQQLRYWPNWKHDDILDALAFMPFSRKVRFASEYAPPKAMLEPTMRETVELGARRDFAGWL